MAAEEVDHDPVVLLGVVEDGRVIRALDHVLLGVPDAIEDRLLAGTAGPLIPRGHQILVPAEHERGRRDPRQPQAEVHVAHRLTRGGEDLEPVRVAEDLLDGIDRGDAVRRLEKRPGEGLPGDQLRENAAPRAVGIHRRDVDPVLEDEAPRGAELRRSAVDDDRGRPLRVLAREDDRDHSTHRGAVDVRRLDVEDVHQPGDVVCPDLHVVVLEWPVGGAVAAQVEVHHPEALGQLGCRWREVEVPEACAVDLQHRLAFPRDVVPEVGAVDPCFAFHRSSRLAEARVSHDVWRQLMSCRRVVRLTPTRPSTGKDMRCPV